MKKIILQSAVSMGLYFLCTVIGEGMNSGAAMFVGWVGGASALGAWLLIGEVVKDG
jgi:hypothetical protein